MIEREHFGSSRNFPVLFEIAVFICIHSGYKADATLERLLAVWWTTELRRLLIKQSVTFLLPPKQFYLAFATWIVHVYSRFQCVLSAQKFNEEAPI